MREQIKKELKVLSKITQIGDFYGVKQEHYQRDIHIYYGLTNSGKTYSAIQELKRLPKDKKGIYLAPLRLLAREIYDTLTVEGCGINLITGEEIIKTNESNIQSSTIEMLNLNETYDLAIIDEAQMINDEQRGNAWIRAILGVKAKKVIILCAPVITKFLSNLIIDNKILNN